jgi:hypothetical protein
MVQSGGFDFGWATVLARTAVAKENPERCGGTSRLIEHAALFTALYSTVGSSMLYCLILKHKLEEDSTPSTTGRTYLQRSLLWRKGQEVSTLERNKFPPPERI